MLEIDSALNAYNNANSEGLKSKLSANSRANSHYESNFDSPNLSKDDAALKEQTDAFEAFLVKQVLDISLKHEDGGLFPKDAGDKIYNSMYNDAMSKALSGNLGFSRLLYDFLKERTK